MARDERFRTLDSCSATHARERGSKSVNSVAHFVKKSRFHCISAGGLFVLLPSMCILYDIHIVAWLAVTRSFGSWCHKFWMKSHMSSSSPRRRLTSFVGREGRLPPTNLALASCAVKPWNGGFPIYIWVGVSLWLSTTMGIRTS